MRSVLVTLIFLLLQYKISAQPPQLVVPVGHMKNIEQAGFSPDNKLLYTFSASSNVVKIWDVKTSKLLFNLKDTGDVYMQLDNFGITPDSKYLYARITKANGTTQDDALSLFSYKIWDLTNGNYVKDVDNMFSLGKPFTTDLRYTLVHQYRTLKKQQLISGKQRTLKQYAANIVFYQFDDRSNRAIVGTDHTVDLWNLDTDKISTTVDLKPHGKLQYAKMEWNKSLLTAITTKGAVVFNVSTGKMLISVNVPFGNIIKADVDLSGTSLVLLTTKGFFQYDLQTKQLLNKFADEATASEYKPFAQQIYRRNQASGYLRYLEIAPQFSFLSRRNLSNWTVLLGMVGEKELQESEEYDFGTLEEMPISKDGRKQIFPFINRALSDTALYIYTDGIPATHSLSQIHGKAIDFTTVKLSQSGKYFYRNENDTLVVTSTDEVFRALAIEASDRSRYFFSNDDRLLLVANQTGAFDIYDVPSAKRISFFRDSKSDFLVQLNPSKQEFVVLTPDAQLKVRSFTQQVVFDTLLAPSFEAYLADSTIGYNGDLENMYARYSGNGKCLFVYLNFDMDENDAMLVYETGKYNIQYLLQRKQLEKAGLPSDLFENFLVDQTGSYLFMVDKEGAIYRLHLATGKVKKVVTMDEQGFEPIVSDAFKKYVATSWQNKIAENDTRHYAISANNKWLYLLKGMSDIPKRMSYKLQVYGAANLELYREYIVTPTLPDLYPEYLADLDTTKLLIIGSKSALLPISSFRMSENAAGEPARLYLMNESGTDFSFDLEKKRLFSTDSLFNSYQMVFSADRKLLVTFRGYGYLQVYNWDKRKQLTFFDVHDAPVNAFSLSNDGKYALSKAADGSFIVWKMPSLNGKDNGSLLFRSFYFDDGSFITVNKDGYYTSSKNAMNKLYYRKGQQRISFSQLDLKYNRPDKVLQSTGCTDTALITGYRKAYYKRLRRVGVDSLHFIKEVDPPVCNIRNENEVSDSTQLGLLKLNVYAKDERTGLKYFNIRVNEVPMYGSRGISLGSRKTFDTTLMLPLSFGSNYVEVSVMNQKGIESYRTPVNIVYYDTSETKPVENKYFIGVGIDNFAEKGYDLKYSAKDIINLSEELSYQGYQVLDTLFNEHVTAENVKRLKEKLTATTVHDKVVIAYSGHGLLSSSFDYYLSSYNIQFSKPEVNGISYDLFESLLDSISPRRKLMLIDACHSGEVDKEELERIQRHNSSKGNKGIIIHAYRNKARVGMTNSIDLMQDLFGNGGRNIGATIISAAGGTQFAIERKDLENGVFTYALIEALYNAATISEIKKYVNQRVLQLTKGIQRPTSRNETLMVDWKLN